MCGIAGVLGREAVDHVPAILARIAHRGPDGQGHFVSPDGTVVLCHTRLAIQDVSEGGAQPMAAANGQVVITFNGEIYNFRELAAGLRAKGYIFRSHSDTEVLLAMYLDMGTAMLEKLNGIFAFAIWDGRDNTCLLARDGVGVKPLYISEEGGCITFASELKALLTLPWIARDLDVQALGHYLQYLWCPSPSTPLLAVHKLSPGEAIVVRDGRIVRRWQHYTLPAPGPLQGLSTEDWIDKVRQGLAAAVRRQMVADVPVGAFLSGGLDSSAIAAEARQYASGRLQCFTIDFDAALAAQEGFARDLPYARQVAKHLDVDLHVVNVGADLADSLQRMVWDLDEPQADFSALNVKLIAGLAREHGIKVLLSGAGGDDVFTGYRRHRALALDAWWRLLPGPLRSAMGSVGRQLPTTWPLLRRVSRLLAAGSVDPDHRMASYFDWTPPDTAAHLLAPALDGAALQQPLQAAMPGMPASASHLQRMLLLEQRFFLADHNLNYTDKMGMAVGVETRVPFLDPDLMALAASIPDVLRQRGAEGKWILKKAMEGMLPENVIYRPKTGFGVPLRAWLRGPMREMLHDLLSPGSLQRRGLFDPGAVRALVQDFEVGRADSAYTLLSLMCIELWCRGFVDGAAEAASSSGTASSRAQPALIQLTP